MKSTKQTSNKALKALEAKGLITKTEIYTNGIKFCKYTSVYKDFNSSQKIIPPIKNLEGGSQKIIPGGSQKIIPNKIDNIKIDNNIDNKKKSIKENDEQEIQNLIYLQELDIQYNLNEYVKMRKRIKKPFSFYAFKLMLKKLEKMGNIKDQNKILENSIMNNWQGIFELKEEVKKTKAGYVDTCNTDYQDGMDLWK